ncbi:MAG: cdisaccharide synthetase [Synergistaceae bacterium]|nr:cdisaccharide synthetase [Synergistaceae bacterium]
MKVGVVCNAPGELWGWARPVVHELKKRGHEVLLWLIKCPYASGKERDVASRFGCSVAGPHNPVSALSRISKEKVDCVIQLGGDVFWGKQLAKKSPLFCYAYGFKSGLEKCRAVFTAYEKMRREIGNAHVIGDLVKDALKLDLEQEKQPGEMSVWSNYSGNRVVFLPGSRENVRLKSFCLIQEIAKILTQEWVGFKPVVLFPPFANDSELKLWKESNLNPLRLGAGIVMPMADYVVTQPGTNTLEMMHCGSAGLVLAPTSFLKEIPVSGIGGLITKIPFAGIKLKEYVLRRKLSRLKGYVSWPNRLGNTSILDELVGDVSPHDAARRIIESLSDKERLMSIKRKLLDLSSQGEHSEGKSASEKLCDSI